MMAGATIAVLVGIYPVAADPMTRTFLVWSTALILFGSFNCRADDFMFEMNSPKFKITLPSVPAMAMEPHPMHAAQPHLRFLGSKGPYTVSVITPTAAAGMTALECAAATVRTLGARPGVPQASQIYRTRVNDSTFVALYASLHRGVVRLNAHVLSAAGGTHCIEVHASQMSTSEDDLAPWIEAFAKASIEPD